MADIILFEKPASRKDPAIALVTLTDNYCEQVGIPFGTKALLRRHADPGKADVAMIELENMGPRHEGKTYPVKTGDYIVTY